MALDKLVDSSQLDGALGHTADAIRAKTGESELLTWDMDYGFSVAIGDITSLVDIPKKAAATYNVSTSNRTIESGYYLIGNQTIKGVVVSDTLAAGNIKYNTVVEIGDDADNGRIKNITGTFTATPSGKTALTAAALRSGYAGFINGAQVNGSMPDTTITEGTTTVSGTTATRGTWSQTLGYTAARTISAATFANEATSGKTYVDLSGTTSAPVLVAGDYLYINKGWTDDLKISLAKLVPDGSDVKGHGEYLLLGHSAYDNDGTLVAGTIPTIASTDLSVSGKTVTVPVGYYTGASGATAVSASVADGDYTPSVSSQGTNTAAAFTPSTSGTITDITTATQPSGTDGTDYWTITPSGSKTTGKARAKATATIGTAGYIATGSKTTSSYTTWNITTNINAGTASYIPKAVITGSSANATATTTVAPGTVSISKQSTPSGVTNAASGDATTTAPSSGVYVAVKANAAANSTGATSAISGSGSATVTTAGYAPSSLTGSISVSGTATAKTSSKDSFVTYVPITTTSATVSGKTVSYGSGWIAEGSKSVADGAYSASVTSASISVVPVVTGAIAGTIIDIGTTTAPSGTDGTDYWTITPSGSVTTTGNARSKAKATISTTGYIEAGSTTTGYKNVTITPTVTDGENRYIVKGTVTNNTSGGTSTATINRGSQIKIGAGFYPSDLYYTAQANSGSLILTTSYYSNTAISCDGYATVRVVGITVGENNSFSVNNSGDTTITSDSATEGSLVVSAYNSSGTLESDKSIISAGKWVNTNVTTSGTYYGRVVVPNTMLIPSGNIQLTQSTSTDVSAYATATVRGVTAAISGGGLSGTATASSSTATISDSTNTSGISFTTACTATRAKVSCTASTAGWASGTIKELAQDTGTMTAKTYYINSVSLPKGKSFSITVYTGASTQTTFTFTTDANGNTVVTE